MSEFLVGMFLGCVLTFFILILISVFHKPNFKVGDKLIYKSNEFSEPECIVKNVGKYSYHLLYINGYRESGIYTKSIEQINDDYMKYKEKA